MSALEEFAKRKCLSVDYLRSGGLEDDQRGILIKNGTNARSRVRQHVATPKPTFWLSGDQRPIRVFGYDRVDKMSKLAKDHLLIVEGESDCLALWYHKVPAVGVPGATMFDKLESADFCWAENIYIVREPGEAGGKFVAGVASRVRALGFVGTVAEIA